MGGAPGSVPTQDLAAWTLPESERPQAGAVVDEDGPVVGADGAERPEDRATVTVPDVLGLPARAAVRRIHEAGLRVEWSGSGVVRQVVPRAGSILTPGDTVRVASVREAGDE